MQTNEFRTNKIDGALGAMIIEDQPTHSIYDTRLAYFVKHVNTWSINNE